MSNVMMFYVPVDCCEDVFIGGIWHLKSTSFEYIRQNSVDWTWMVNDGNDDRDRSEANTRPSRALLCGVNNENHRGL